MACSRPRDGQSQATMLSHSPDPNKGVPSSSRSRRIPSGIAAPSNRGPQAASRQRCTAQRRPAFAFAAAAQPCLPAQPGHRGSPPSLITPRSTDVTPCCSTGGQAQGRRAGLRKGLGDQPTQEVNSLGAVRSEGRPRTGKTQQNESRRAAADLRHAWSVGHNQEGQACTGCGAGLQRHPQKTPTENTRCCGLERERQEASCGARTGIQSRGYVCVAGQESVEQGRK